MTKSMRIKDFPDYYITDTGDVYSRIYHPIQNPQTRIRKIKTTLNKQTGYFRVTLCKNKKHYTQRVHRLVAQAFIPNPENKPQINHKNGIRTDNRVENLEWCTCKENIQHSYNVLHRNPSCGMRNKFGKLHHRSKIIQQIQGGKVVAEFYGSNEASKKTSICARNIRKVCAGERKRAGNFVWQYKK